MLTTHPYAPRYTCTTSWLLHHIEVDKCCIPRHLVEEPIQAGESSSTGTGVMRFGSGSSTRDATIASVAKRRDGIVNLQYANRARRRFEPAASSAEGVASHGGSGEIYLPVKFRLAVGTVNVSQVHSEILTTRQVLNEQGAR